MFTLFRLLELLGTVAGLVLGMLGGARLFGMAGGLGGAVAGALLGFILGRIPLVLGLLWLARDLTSKSTAELRSDLHSSQCLTPNLVLLELRRRGEDIRCELPVVLDLLASADMGQRSYGWAALTSAFPELVEQIRDYRMGDSVEGCRRKTEVLRLTAK